MKTANPLHKAVTHAKHAEDTLWRESKFGDEWDDALRSRWIQLWTHAQYLQRLLKVVETYENT